MGKLDRSVNCLEKMGGFGWQGFGGVGELGVGVMRVMRLSVMRFAIGLDESLSCWPTEALASPMPMLASDYSTGLARHESQTQEATQGWI